MHTSLLVTFALAGFLAGDGAASRLARASTPTWLTNYTQAQKTARKEGRPLAVFVGAGDAGYDQVSRKGTLSSGVQQLLVQKYVCVYLDTGKPAGQKLAEAFEITGRGLVLSDRSGQLQAFHHDGELSDADLLRNLERFAGPIAIRTTESNSRSRVSYYPANGYNGTTPAYAVPSFGGGRC